MKPIVIFGTGKIAEVVSQVIADHSLFEVAAYTCDKQFVGDGSFLDRRVVDFETVEQTFPPDVYDLFVALGYQDLNALRASRVEDARKKGYKLVSVVHPKANLYSDLKMGDNCFVMDTVAIHPRVQLGNNVFVWSSAIIGHHSSIGNNCWITSGSNVGGNVTVGDATFLAINATIAHSVRVGKECFIGANALLTKVIQDQVVIVAESTKPFRLNSQQFLKISRFTNL